jgi:hypothetical protein
MKAAAGGSHSQDGAAGLALAVVIAGLTITGMLFLPMLTSKTAQRNRAREEARLAQLEASFREYVRLRQIIPGSATWLTALGSIGSLNTTQVSCVFPEFPDDTSTRRVFVIDEFLGGSIPLLPYTQSDNGLTGTATNLLNSRARAMILSSSKRGLSLPVSSGFLSQSDFDSIWNWTHNPATQSAPAGWPEEWNGQSEYLHVKPLYLPGLFSKVTVQNASFGHGLSVIPSILPSSATDYYFLNGSPMTLASTLGIIKQRHIVQGDTSFNFGSSASSPLIWFKMEESSGTYATNSGTLGATARGTITSGIGYQKNGPRPSTYPLFSSSNYAMDFNDAREYISTTTSAMSDLRAFTLGIWVYVDAFRDSRTGLLGQNDAVELGFIDTRSVQLWTSGGGSVTVSWPFSTGSWHHIAATGDGSAVRLYFDGVQVGSGSAKTSNYGSSSYAFHVGGAVVFDAPVSGSRYDGQLDEAIMYDRALSAAEVLLLATGVVP